MGCEGIDESFPLTGHRSLYGATKLCGELLIQEYTHMYGISAVINRCGVLAGPWQMGKVDQGFMALWVAQHYFEGQLKYMGFGGEGLQVRDVLHMMDLFNLIQYQMQNISQCNEEIYNVGGGMRNSVSLLELTDIVTQMTGKKIYIGSDVTTREADIPFYVSDNTKVKNETQWEPTRNVPKIIEDILHWLKENEIILKPLFRS